MAKILRNDFRSIISQSKKNIFVFCLAFIAATIAIWLLLPKPELTISIAIRLISFGIATYIVVKYREWKIMFLAVMFFLMAARQTFTLMLWMKVMEKNETTKLISELPGFVVTLLSFLSIVYIGSLLSGKSKIIAKQRKDIKTLNKLVPICANCKKIRDDEGYWNQIELYLRDHAEIEFSHGICPECSRKLYPELYERSCRR